MNILLAEIVRDYRGRERTLKVLLKPSNCIFIISFSIWIISLLFAKLSALMIRSVFRFFRMLVGVLDLRRGGDIDRFACATAAAVHCSSVGRGIFRPKIKLFPIKIATLCISEYTKKSVKQSDIANTERFWYILQIFSGSAELGRNRQNSDISLSDITKFDCTLLIKR
jgi:hypothetical protein